MNKRKLITEKEDTHEHPGHTDKETSVAKGQSETGRLEKRKNAIVASLNMLKKPTSSVLLDHNFKSTGSDAIRIEIHARPRIRDRKADNERRDTN